MIRSNEAQEADSVDRRWEDTTLSVAERVEELMRRMTLAEKVAQLGSRWIGARLQDIGADREPDLAEPTLNVAPMQDLFAAGGKISLEEASRHGLGHLTRVYGSAPVTPRKVPPSWCASSTWCSMRRGSESPRSCTRNA